MASESEFLALATPRGPNGRCGATVWGWDEEGVVLMIDLLPSKSTWEPCFVERCDPPMPSGTLLQDAGVHKVFPHWHFGGAVPLMGWGEEKSLIPFLSLFLHLHETNTWAQVKFLAEQARTFSEKKHNTVPANLELELKQRKV